MAIDTSSGTEISSKKYRKQLKPIPILDRKLLLQSLPKSIQRVLKPKHLDVFYQALHRANYPRDLKHFVSTLLSSYTSLPLEKVDVKLPNCFMLHIARHCEEDNKQQQQHDDYCYATITSKIQLVLHSLDKTTTKLAIQLQDGHVIEAVIMRHYDSSGKRKQQHVTLCVSSQVGCAMKCVFCATGTMGMRGNLTSGEILEQLVHASSFLDKDKIRNIVFMGMGEPLNNYDNVVAACRVMVDRRTWSLQHHHVTVSTVGIISKMYQLTKDIPFVNLALSLHAPNQSMREKVVPTAKQYPLPDLMDALDQHSNMNIATNNTNTNEIAPTTSKSQTKRRRAMIEYIMLNGDTSSLECAHELGKLCENRNVVVNLIPYNPTENDTLSSPSLERILEFQRIVKSYGCFCFIRKTMGQDISGACGQLAVVTTGGTVQDIEDVLLLDQKRKTSRTKGKVKSKRNKTTVLSSTSSNDAKKEDFEEVHTTSVLVEHNSSNMNTSFDPQQMPIVSKDTSACHHADNDLSQWIFPLKIATSISFACFAVSGILLMTRRKQ